MGDTGWRDHFWEVEPATGVSDLSRPCWRAPPKATRQLFVFSPKMVAVRPPQSPPHLLLHIWST